MQKQPTGEIYKYVNNTLSLFASIPGGHIGHMVYLKDHFYLTNARNHKIFKISLDGTISVLIGTGKQRNIDQSNTLQHIRRITIE